MGWYDTNYNRRIPIAVNLEYVGGVPPALTVTKDVQITIPVNFGAFWDSIRADAFDAIITLHDGITLATFKRNSFNYANKELVIHVQNYTYDNKEQSTGVLYLYFDNASATDLSTVFSAGTTITGTAFIGLPRGRKVESEIGGNNLTNAPGAIVTKSVDEKIYVWFNYRDQLINSLSPYNQRNELETPKQIKIFSFDSTGTDSSSRYDKNETVFSAGYVGIMVQNGVNDTTYQIGGFLTTSLLQEIRLAAFIEIKNKYPPS